MTTYVDLTWKGEGDVSLYARDYAGSGGPARCPVVCIHGLTRNSADFEDVAPWIAAQGRRVIAVDIRGRGRSARDPDPAALQPARVRGRRAEAPRRCRHRTCRLHRHLHGRHHHDGDRDEAACAPSPRPC